jgi:Lipocalin-like domain
MDPSALIGHWRLLDAIAVDTGDQLVGPLFGTRPLGHLHYAENGSMEVVLTAGGELSGQTPWGTPAPSYYAYAGTYEVQGDQVRHRVASASDPTITGRVLRRTWRLQEDRLILYWRLPNKMRGHLLWRPVSPGTFSSA